MNPGGQTYLRGLSFANGQTFFKTQNIHRSPRCHGTPRCTKSPKISNHFKMSKEKTKMSQQAQHYWSGRNGPKKIQDIIRPQRVEQRYISANNTHINKAIVGTYNIKIVIYCGLMQTESLSSHEPNKFVQKFKVQDLKKTHMKTKNNKINTICYYTMNKL